MPTARLIIHVVLDDVGSEQYANYNRNGATPGVPSCPFAAGLAAGGVQLENYFAEAFCSPARANHMAGRHTEDHGVGNIIENDAEIPLLMKELLLPEVLKTYYGSQIDTAGIGKWHLGNAQVGGKKNPNQAGFDYWFGSERNVIDFYDAAFFTQGETRSTLGRYLPLVMANEAISWIRRFCASRTQRGYLYLPFHLPHEPFDRPPSDLYDTGAWTLPGVNPSDNLPATISPYLKANIEASDVLMDRIWTAVPAWLRDETVLIVTSDNGTLSTALAAETYPAGLGGGTYNGTHGKRSSFDPGIRVPAWVYSTNTGLVASPGRSITGLMQSLDWYATTLDLFGVPWQEIVSAQGPQGQGQPATVRSKSIAGSLTANVATTNREYAIGGIFSTNGYSKGAALGRRWISDGRYKLIFPTASTAFSIPALYDLVERPKEDSVVIEPLSGSPDRARLQAEWDAFYESLP